MFREELEAALNAEFGSNESCEPFEFDPTTCHPRGSMAVTYSDGNLKIRCFHCNKSMGTFPIAKKEG